MPAFNIMDQPAGKPPDGVVPNFDDPPNKNALTLGILTFCLALASIAVVLRIYTRCFIVRKVQVQDFFLVAAYGLYLALMVLYFRLLNYPGWFVHLWDLTIGGLTEFLHVAIITTCLFLGFYIAIKTAILLEWISIFLPDGGNRRNLFFWACHFIIWSNLIFCTAELILVNLSCEPYEYLWNRTIEGHCRINTAYTSLSAAVFAFSTDIIILFIPQRVIWTLNMSWRRKLGISVVFALGLAACTASIVRLYYTVERAGSSDVAYHLSSVQLTASGEGAAAILVLCVPAIPKAFSAIKLPSLFSSRSWLNLVSAGRYRSSEQSLKKNSSGIPPPDEVGRNRWHIVVSGSESHLVPLTEVPSAKMRRHDLELGNNIVRSTEFRTKEHHGFDPTIASEEHQRQHPWE
ncbi:hypothetical protein GGS20DRAFT_99875 [Poronia punctata]|nr:hypothetical protein GGS20DRAFT_99875 [Poronia punctata]